ncbi:hypothetical protein M885DRAFT_538952, partial [Pelagophyceae sp. CCMP2097]
MCRARGTRRGRSARRAPSRPSARSTLQPSAPPVITAVSSDDNIWGWDDVTEDDPAADDPSTAAAAHLHAAALAEANRCKDALTDAEARAVTRALRSAPRTVVSDGFNAEVTGEHAARLNPSGWLVDEVINFYMALLQDRDKRRCKADATAKPCHFFNSFFIPKPMGA